MAALVLLGHCALLEGRLGEALRSLEQALGLYAPESHRDQGFLYGQDTRVGAATSLAWAHWYMGNADRALALAESSVAWARDINHGQSYGLALIYLLRLRYERRETDEVLKLCALHVDAARQHGLVEQVATVDLYRAWAQRDLDVARRCVAQREALGIEKDLPLYNTMAAEVEASHADAGAALERLTRAHALVAELEEHLYLPKILCLEGTLLAARGAVDRAEACLAEAADLARAQGSRMLELEAATALCRVLAGTAGAAGAEARLADVYQGFTEGFDAAPVAEARRALGALAKTG
jgi:tetratricopeptide (TPR) repeat protein